jgi:hypothetical protein
MSAPPTLISPPNYTAISALIRRIAALEEGGSLKFGALGALDLPDMSNDLALIPGGPEALIDMSSNAIIQFSVGAPALTVQSGFVRVNISDAQMTALGSTEGDVMRFINRTVPGDSLSNEWHGIIQLNLGSLGPQLHIAPQESVKIAFVAGVWITATGL